MVYIQCVRNVADSPFNEPPIVIFHLHPEDSASFFLVHTYILFLRREKKSGG